MISKTWICLGTGVLLASSLAFSGGPEMPQKAPFETSGKPFLQKYCLSCHSNKEAPAGGIWLARGLDVKSLAESRALWDKAAKAVSSGHMPPKTAPQPSANERKTFVDNLQTTLTGDCSLADAGQVTLRRLNRAEYNNTVRDLFGIDFKPADDFPSDDVGYGFDNIGDVLSLSPIHLEKYLRAAEQIAERAIIAFKPKVTRFEAEAFKTQGGARLMGEGISMFSASSAALNFKAPSNGNYRLKILAWAQQAGPEIAKLRVSVGGKSLGDIEIKGTQAAPSLIELPAEITQGEQKIEIAFINDYYDPNQPDPKNRDRNAYLQFLEIVGPLNAPNEYPASHRAILFARPNGTNLEAVSAQVIEAFAKKAFRRPPTSSEVQRLVGIAKKAYANGESYEKGIQLAVTACLVSPHFLFRVELDAPGATRGLTDWEIASRLSYFLWSSTPDEELMRLAERGELNKKEVLLAQTKRMLLDKRASALADNFAGQWLQLRKLETLEMSKAEFPAFSPELRSAMIAETKLFFQEVLSQDRPITDFLSADYSFVNGILAKHYGIEGVTGNEFRKIALKAGNRGGLLGQASFLTVTSNPTRTSPVKRGKYVLENLLGTAPPPPPPSVDSLNEKKEAIKGLTMKQRLAEHRKDPTCNSCHVQMDPIGLALENFNGIGQWRTQDDTGVAVDTVSALPDGVTLKGSDDLKKYLLSKKPEFTQAFAEKMLTYALGRGIYAEDKCHTDAVAAFARSKELKISAFIEAIVTSEPFLKRGKPSATIAK